MYTLREPRGPYTRDSGSEYGLLRPDNSIPREENLAGAET